MCCRINSSDRASLGHNFRGAPSGQEERCVENRTSVKSCTTEALCWRAQGGYMELGVWKTNATPYCTEPAAEPRRIASASSVQLRECCIRCWLEKVGVTTRARQGRQGGKTSRCTTSGSALVDFIKCSQTLRNQVLRSGLYKGHSLDSTSG